MAQSVMTILTEYINKYKRRLLIVQLQNENQCNHIYRSDLCYREMHFLKLSIWMFDPHFAGLLCIQKKQQRIIKGKVLKSFGSAGLDFIYISGNLTHYSKVVFLFSIY